MRSCMSIRPILSKLSWVAILKASSKLCRSSISALEYSYIPTFERGERSCEQFPALALLMISWPIRVLGASGVFRRKQHDVSFRSHEFLFGITRHVSTFRLKHSWIAGNYDLIVRHAGRGDDNILVRFSFRCHTETVSQIWGTGLTIMVQTRWF